jgi:hypothetical protein
VTEPASTNLTAAPSVDPATQGPISTKPIVSKQTRTITTIVSIVVIVLVLAILGFIGYLMYASYDAAGEGVVPATVRLRDIAFVVMALETLVLMVLVLIVIVLLAVLIVLVYDRVIPVLEQLNRTVNTVADTVHTVRGTTTFVSDKVVTPFIELSSYAAGAVRILKGILDLWPRGNRSNDQQETLASDE